MDTLTILVIMKSISVSTILAGPLRNDQYVSIHNQRWNHPCFENAPVLSDVTVDLPINFELPVFSIGQTFSTTSIILEESLLVNHLILSSIGEYLPCVSAFHPSRHRYRSTGSRAMSWNSHCRPINELVNTVMYHGFPNCTVQHFCSNEVYIIQQCFDDLTLTVMALELVSNRTIGDRRYPTANIQVLLLKLYDVMCHVLDLESVSVSTIDFREFHSKTGNTFHEINNLNSADLQEFAYILFSSIQLLLTNVNSVIELRLRLLQTN